MPATRPRASFEPISPDFDLKSLVETTPNFSYVDRISCDMIDQQGMAAFDKLILLHVVIAGKPLIIDGFEDRLDPWTFTPSWLRDNCGDKHENAWDLRSKELLPLTMAHYLNNMGMLTNQFFAKLDAYKEKKRQRVYLKDIDCPTVWQDKLKEHIPNSLYYLNESTGEVGGPGAALENNVAGKRLGKGIARAGDLMSSLPPDMRAENLMCYIGHEGTYTPAHREMCASLGHNIMVEASGTVSEDGKPERLGSSIWFMTESKDRHLVSEYWLSVLGHDIEVEDHFAQIVAWKKAPFHVYVVEQRPGDFILIPPLAPHQVWNRGSRTMKVAWNRTTVETLEMALHEALPRSRIVCRDEQYKNKAIVYYTLQKYSGLLTMAQSQASHMSPGDATQFLRTEKIKQLRKDFRRLFNMYRDILLSEMFNPDDRDVPKSIEYMPFDGNVTCAYCRCNIFNRFLTCPSCKDVLGHNVGDPEGDPYDVCMDCYAMGRSCACISNLKWIEQFRWKELAAKYETWRNLIIALDGGQITEKTPLPILEVRRRYEKKTLAEVCKQQLKRRPWKDVHKGGKDPDKLSEDEGEEIIVDDNGNVKKVQKKRPKNWQNNNNPCHVCKHHHPNWKMAQCTKCERWWCYGTLFRGWDKMPMDIMSDPEWECPHCLGICFAGSCKRDGKMQPYEPKGTLLGHDTRKVADVRSVEALVDFSVSNLQWLKDDDPVDRSESRRLKNAGQEAEKAKAVDPTIDLDEDAEGEAEHADNSPVQLADSPPAQIDPALTGSIGADAQINDEQELARRLQEANASLHTSAARDDGRSAEDFEAQDGFRPVNHAGYIPPGSLYPQPDPYSSYSYPGHTNSSLDQLDSIRPFKPTKRVRIEENEHGDISMTKGSKAKKPRLSALGFRSTDLAADTDPNPAQLKAKTEAQRQFEREKERKLIEKAKVDGRFIMFQAALKGKKSLVTLKIPGIRLQQLLATQAAQAALAVGDNNDVNKGGNAANDSPAPSDDEGTDDEEIIVLKSDIAPAKPKPAPERNEQRQREDRIIKQTAKMARVPVEKDASYGSRDRTSKPKTGQSSSKRSERVHSTREYEVIDIGSDEEVDGTDNLASGPNGNDTAQRDRRSLPGYMRNRHPDDDQEGPFPDFLPNSFKDGVHKASSRKKASAKVNSAPPSVSKPTAAQSINTPSPIKPTNGSSSAKTNGAMRNNDGQPRATTISTPRRPRGRPSKNSKLRPASSVDSFQASIDEENRLAKLQALEMYGDV